MKKAILSTAFSVLFLAACSPSSPAPRDASQPVTTMAGDDVSAQPMDELTHPEWSRDAVIYQINTRQYSEEGTFAAVETDLPRIKSLGVDILWLMPIHPIGEARRKGELGSPYAVKDFKAVNPELGTLENFRSLVDAAHALEMKIIIDWVANHTAWDNQLISEHPDWYTRDNDGNMQSPPGTDWADVADLDYSKEGLRDYMTGALTYWVEEVGIDGYRCDVAGMVPTDFWNTARIKLDAIKPVFMLAEWQEPELHTRAFNASYAWRWKEIMQDIVKGKADAGDMAGYYSDYQTNWPADAMRMTYTSNHDQNTWDGTPLEIYGDALEAAMVLQFTGEGIPLIYNGQEAGNDKQLEFFEKDLIRWNDDHRFQGLFRELVKLKTDNPALHNGAWGGRLTRIENSNAKKIFSFSRQKGGNSVLAIFNMSSEDQKLSFSEAFPQAIYMDFKTEIATSIDSATELSLKPWEYHILTHEK